MMLTGYAPSPRVVKAVGSIAKDLQQRSSTKPGSFFWSKISFDLYWLQLITVLVLDPVMGDQAAMYVDEKVLDEYQELLQHADLILPNQYEAE